MKKVIFFLLFIASLLPADSNARKKLPNPGGSTLPGVPAVCPNLQTVLYVDASVSVSGNGTSWATAKKTLQEALNYANACEKVYAINVAQGVYKPTTDNDREKFFFIGGDYNITGGYAPGGGSRDPVLHPTILDGNINLPGFSTDNSLHVLIVAHETGTVKINGLQIRNGNTVNPASTTMQLFDDLIIDNRNGAGVYVDAPNGVVEFENCIFLANHAENNGGGLYLKSNTAAFANCVFDGNYGGVGGAGVYDETAVLANFSQCIFYKNRGSFQLEDRSAVVPYGELRNCVMYTGDGGSQNFVGVGGAYNLANCVVWGPSTNVVHVGIGHTNYSIHISTSVANNTQWNIGSITLDPEFVNAEDGDGPDNKWFTDDDGLRLRWSSPAINRGNNDYASGITKDIIGKTRILNGVVDMGPYEYQLQAIPPSAPYLAVNGDEVENYVYDGNTAFTKGGKMIVSLTPQPFMGIHAPLYGKVHTKVFIEGSSKYGYVPRHYQVTPENAWQGSSRPVAKVTLYFTQDEFDAYNDAVGAKADQLPTGPNDDANKANLRIHQFYGSSTDGSGLPGTYNSGFRRIDPDDADIEWHSSRIIGPGDPEPGYWSVSFNVHQFSGFFVYADDGPLSVHFGDISAAITGNRLAVNWTTLAETGNSHFEIEASADGARFFTVGTVKSLAADGNSSTVLAYDFSVSVNDILPGISAVAVLLLTMFSFKNKKTRSFMLVAAFACLLLFIACRKGEVQPISPESKLFIRIKQVDKDGRFEYSKIIQAVRK